MHGLFLKLVMSLALVLAGCSQEIAREPPELSGFLKELRETGMDGALLVRVPANEDVEYIAEYAIARYTNTRIISVFKCKDAAKAALNLQASLQNPRLSAQARNGRFIMTASFYPPDEDAAAKIKAKFLAQKFD